VDAYVTSGTAIGLGTGSTAIWAIRRVAERLGDGSLREVRAVPTSAATAAHATALGVPLATLDEVAHLAVTVDGADQVSPTLDLIKGGGGAHLRERVVAQASALLVIVVDDSKLTPVLGDGFALPVEVVPFAVRPESDFLAGLGFAVSRRLDAAGDAAVSDSGNALLDVVTGPIPDPPGLLATLNDRAGVMAVGLFLAMADVVVVAGADGVRELTAGRVPRP